MRTQDGPVASEVIKVVHDDSNKEIKHQEGNDDEADEVDIGKVASAALLFSRIVRSIVTFCVRGADAGEHDLLPSLAGCRPEEDQQRPEERLEVVVSVDVGVVVLGYPAKHLHAHHTVDEED